MSERSIIRVEKPGGALDIARAIESATHGKVVRVTIINNTIRLFEVVHHDGPWCPDCGREIHAYGHGLCMACWNAKKSRI